MLLRRKRTIYLGRSGSLLGSLCSSFLAFQQSYSELPAFTPETFPASGIQSHLWSKAVIGLGTFRSGILITLLVFPSLLSGTPYAFILVRCFMCCSLCLGRSTFSMFSTFI